MTIGEYSMSLKSQQDIAEGIRIYSLSFKHEVTYDKNVYELHITDVEFMSYISRVV